VFARVDAGGRQVAEEVHVPTSEERLERLKRMRAEALLGGGAVRIERQHTWGKLTARERLDLLLDPGSFVELDAFVTHRSTEFGLDAQHILGDGVVTGHGTIDGRLVFVFSQDFTVFGGSLSEAYAEKIVKIMDLAMKVGAAGRGPERLGRCPDPGGRRLAGRLRLDLHSQRPGLGSDPPDLGDHGSLRRGAVYSPAITDFTIMVEGTSYMFVTGPNVVKTVTHEEVDSEYLGGAATHTTKSGVAHLAAPDEATALDDVRRLLSFLPQNNLEEPPRLATDDPVDRRDAALDAIVPDDPGRPYDMHEVIDRVVDDGEFFEIQPAGHRTCWSASPISGAERRIVAQQPAVLAGALDIQSSVKGARFVRTCDAYNVPLVTFIDVPGFLPGVNQEHGGIIKEGAKLLYAYCEATVPKVSVITRKAYGGAYDVMSSKHVRGDVNFAWPTAEIAVMGAEGAVNIIFKDLIAGAADPVAERRRLVAEYEAEFNHPYVAASRGWIDDVILPSETRPRLIAALEMLGDKRETNPRKKHGNIPL